MANSESQSGDRDLLQAAIRESLRRLDESIDPPDAVTVADYLAGCADEQQIEQVHKAMMVSSEFRREMVVLAGEYERIVEQSRLLRPEADQAVPPLHELHNYTATRVGGERRRGRVWPVYLLIAAAAAIVVLAVTVMWSGEPKSFELMEAAVDRAHLIDNQTRSRSAARTATYDSIREAAIASFRERLQFDAGVFSLRERPGSVARTGDGISVTLVDDTGNELVSVVLKPEHRLKRTATSVFVMAIPEGVIDGELLDADDTFDLYRLTTETDSVRAYWPEFWGSHVLITACSREATFWHCSCAQLLDRDQ